MTHTKLSPSPRNSLRLRQVIQSRWALLLGALGELGLPHHATAAAVAETAQPETYAVFMGGLGLLVMTQVIRNRRTY